MKRFICWTCFFIPFIGVLSSSVGCKTIRPGPTQATGQAISRATVRNESITYHVEPVAKRAKGEDKARLQSALMDASEQKKDLAEADAQNILTGQRESAAAEQLTRVQSDAFYRFGRWCAWIWGFIWKWSLAILGVSVLLRGIALAFPGPIGGVLSLISTAGLGVLTAGVSLFQAGADNLFFRIIRPKEKMKEVIDAGGGVATTTTPAGTVTVVGDATGTTTTDPAMPNEL